MPHSSAENLPPYTPLLPEAPRVLVHARGTMPPLECMFWERVRRAMRARGVELLLTGHLRPQQPMDAPFLKARNGLKEVLPPRPEQGWDWWMRRPMALDEEALLARETLWRGEAESEARLEQRRAALHFFAHFYTAAVAAARPRLCLIWNGRHPQEMLLDQICREAGAAVWYIERAPFPSSVHVDPEGILAGSSAAQRTSWTWPDADVRAQWREVAERVEAQYREAPQTWWEQPGRKEASAIRRKLGLREGERVVLFPGQVDADTQNLFFSPHFSSNLEAFRWLSEQLRDKQVFLLGKHHPKSDTPPGAYREALQCRGAWTTDIALEDCWPLVDRVAAVNSTVLFEGLMMEKPALALGQSLLDGKDIAHEVADMQDASAIIDAWLCGEDAEARLERWRDFAAWLMSTSVYSMAAREDAAGMRGAEALGEVLAAAAHAAPEVQPPQALPAFLDAVSLWDEAREAQHEGVKEILRGLNIAVKASVGRAFPRAYARLLDAANRLYGAGPHER